MDQVKICVMGYSGSGKSTLSKKLAERYSLPLLYLDSVQFLPGWVERDRAEALALVDDFMRNPEWVIDGNYQKFRQERRLEEADRVYLLLFPRRVCLWRAFTRWLKNRHQVRESSAAGCVDKFDWEFIRWILFDGRSHKFRQHYADIQRLYADKTVVFTDQKSVDAFFSRLEC